MPLEPESVPAPEKGSEELARRIHQLEMDNERLRLELWRLRRKPSRVIGFTVLALGAAMLALSAAYPSPSFAFMGLSLTFWGGLLLYIRPVSYVKSMLLESTIASTLVVLGRILEELNYRGKPVYLPPRYLGDVKAGRVFIPYEEPRIPPIGELSEARVFLGNPNGMLIAPPGLSLVNLYEDELGVSFARMDLDYLRRNLPGLFVEGLEMAEEFEMGVEGDLAYVKMRGSVFAKLCLELKSSGTKICASIGCPLCSSIACALARASGKPVAIDRVESSPDGRCLEAYYRMLEGKDGIEWSFP